MDNKGNAMKHPYIRSFIVPFLLFIIGIAPLLVLSGGVYIYDGDYNVQTLPFIEHISRLLRSGLPAFDWQSDLGMDMWNSYVGYSTSPFSIILLALPLKVLPYAHTIVQALKVGLCGLFAYIYCRQYVKQDRSAYICGLLYAFSGFMIYNLVYPFLDSYCLFPLTLYAFDRLMKNNTHAGFALMLAVNGFVNYYLLWEECVFILIYFIVKLISKEYPGFGVKKFLALAFETLSGVAASAAVLLPSAITLASNSRAGKLIFEDNLLAYSEQGAVLRALQGLLLPPDMTGAGWYFYDRQLSLSAPQMYLPLFSVIGVLWAYKHYKKDWTCRIVTISAVVLAVPLFNSVFSMLNASYYARWVHMPMLIMIVMSGRFVDEMETADVKTPIKINAIALAVLGAVGVFSVYIRDLLPDNDRTLWLMSIVTAGLSLLIMYNFYQPTDSLKFLSFGNLGRIVCVICAALMLERSMVIIMADEMSNVPNHVERIYNNMEPVEIRDDDFYRICNAQSLNVGLNWGYGNMNSFNSVITGSETDFYTAVGVKRNQSCTLGYSHHALNTFLSVKYDFVYNKPLAGGVEVDPQVLSYNREGFGDRQVHGKYVIFENSAFVPMGFTYDNYINIADVQPYEAEEDQQTEEEDTQFGAVSADEDGYKYTEPLDNEKLLLKAIWLEDEQIAKYGDILKPLSEKEAEDTSEETYYKDCEARRKNACSEFITNGSGFTAKTTLDKDNLVFFSVPYSDGFTAFVDGSRTEIEKVFGGLCAVYVPKGEHSIEFKYETPGLSAGIKISCLSLGMIIVYGAVMLIMKKKDKTQKES